jgi:hypothetical protein
MVDKLCKNQSKWINKGLSLTFWFVGDLGGPPVISPIACELYWLRIKNPDKDEGAEGDAEHVLSDTIHHLSY